MISFLARLISLTMLVFYTNILYWVKKFAINNVFHATWELHAKNWQRPSLTKTKVINLAYTIIKSRIATSIE